MINCVVPLRHAMRRDENGTRGPFPVLDLRPREGDRTQMSGRRFGRSGVARANSDRPKSNYITLEGFKTMQAEFENLWTVERPTVTQAVSVAAALGDRSENADYIYGKKRLREIDSRIRFLRKRLDDLTVVKERPDREDKVFFGAWVTLEDPDGETVCYRIVGPDEFDAGRGSISMDSPVGRRLLGRELDEEVQVVRPRGTTVYLIVAIDYFDPAVG
ncbi:MAG: transcription elongation factor GreB [Myxococcota bacterium]|jgi:transcription elongation factor GreB